MASFCTWRDSQTFKHNDGSSKTFKLNSPHRANNLQAMTEMVLSGAGLHVGPEWYFNDHLTNGNLVEVVPEWKPPIFPFTALYRRSTFVSAKVSAFLDLAKRECSVISGMFQR